MADKESGSATELARKYALKNAHDYGKAVASAVTGKLLSAGIGIKPEEAKKEADAAVKWVNSLSEAEISTEYQKYAKEFDSQSKEKAVRTAKPKMELEGVKVGDFVSRYSPEPSGYATIGHAKHALLNSEFARIYKGRVYLYFDDTNPEKCKQEYVDAMRKDMEWLGIDFDKEYYASDNVEKIYKYARELIEHGVLYACECPQEEMKRMRFAGEDCKHRDTKPERSMETFGEMLSGRLDEGSSVLRFKGDMKSQNTAMRDPVMLRIVKATHYRQGDKYKVWPVYDFNTPILDSLNGITDVIRGKEYELHDELSRSILDALRLRVPRMHAEARLHIKGNITQKRVIRKLIEDKIIDRWDDPRLMTLMALRRRGILPAAIREFMMRFGMSKTDGTVGIDMLLAENKKLIDTAAKHLFFVADPVKTVVKGADKKYVRLHLHPSNDFGYREYNTGDTFFIAGEDAVSLQQDEIVRLKDFITIRVKKSTKSLVTAEPEYSSGQVKIIQWVPEKNNVKCSVMVAGSLVDEHDNLIKDSLKVVEGYVEGYANKLNERDIVQFERFGYCTLDDKKSMSFIFISK